MSPAFWGLAAGSLLGVVLGMLIPDVMATFGLVILLAPIGAFVGWLAGRIVSRVMRRSHNVRDE